MPILCATVRGLWLGAAMMLAPWPASAQELPDGAGRDVVQKACATCHPATLLMGRNMTREQWSAEVARMVQEGAKLSDAELTQAVDYLAKAFPSGPNATPSAPPAAGRGGRGGRPGGSPRSKQGSGRGGTGGGSGSGGSQYVAPDGDALYAFVMPAK